MKYISKTLEFLVDTPSVITLGKFDGLHRGHELLLRRLQEESRQRHYASIAFSFDIPPRNSVEGIQAQVLTTNQEKHYIFEQYGIDYLIECPFTREVMTMEPEAFIRWITQALSVKAFVIGSDFHFGYQRQGNYQVLQHFEEKYGYETIVLTKLQDSDRDISSTYVREELSVGNIRKANELLGYEYFLTSEVIHGRKLGRTIGIPTINMVLPPEKLLPPNGVYITRVQVGEKWYMGVTNVGCKPTVGDKNPVGVETYIIDFCQDVYGRVITINFLDRIREERRFESIDDLKQQMSQDIAYAQAAFYQGLF